MFVVRNLNGNTHVDCHFNILEILVKQGVPNTLFNEDKTVKDHRNHRTYRTSI